MSTTRGSIQALAVALAGLLLQAGAASAQHGGGARGGHSSGGGHYGGHYGGGGHYRGGGHFGGYYGRGHHGGYYYGGHYPRFYLHGGGGLYGYYGRSPYFYGYYGYPYYFGYGHPYYGYGGYGYAGYGGFGYRGYGGYDYGRYQDDATAAVRLHVDPHEASVFVDGSYAGIADDFDGRSQRLRVPPGRHEIVLKLEGYRTHRIEVDVPAGRPSRIQHRMAEGAGEDAEELTPDAYPEETRGRRDERLHGALSLRGPNADRGDESRGERGEGGRQGVGAVRLSVQPADAAIYVDGEFRGPAGRVRRLELAPGRHSIEVVRPGFETLERAVDIEPDGRIEVDAELRPTGS